MDCRIGLRDLVGGRPTAHARVVVTVTVLACPMCAETERIGVAERRAGAVFVTWQCQACRCRWREPVTTRLANVRAIVP